LVKNYCDGDESAFNKLIPYIDNLVNLVLRVTRIKNEYSSFIDDITQDCRIRCISAFRKWDHSKGPLKYFLQKCFSNIAFTCVVKFKVRREFIPIQFVKEDELGAYTPVEDHGLDVVFKSRIRGFIQDYVFRRVCIAMYLGVFNSTQNMIAKEIAELTDSEYCTIMFFVDYSAVVIRKYYVENGWKINSQILNW
jgi:hypothetical protein